MIKKIHFLFFIIIIINNVYCYLKFNIWSYKFKYFQQGLYTQGTIQVRMSFLDIKSISKEKDKHVYETI